MTCQAATYDWRTIVCELAETGKEEDKLLFNTWLVDDDMGLLQALGRVRCKQVDKSVFDAAIGLLADMAPQFRPQGRHLSMT